VPTAGGQDKRPVADTLVVFKPEYRIVRRQSSNPALHSVPWTGVKFPHLEFEPHQPIVTYLSIRSRVAATGKGHGGRGMD